MIQTLASRIIKYAIRKGYVKDEEYEEYCYALNLLINILISDVSLLIIGFLMHMVWESILFWLVYKALHKFCGGYHFSNSLRCYLSSCVMSPITLVCISMVPYYAAPWQIITVVSALTLCFVSPVEAVNKPLDEREKKVFGRVARILTIVSVIIFIAMEALSLHYVAKIVSLGIVWTAIFAVAGKLYLIYLKKVKNGAK